MAVVRTPRSAWIEAGLRALADGGPDAVRVEVLAESLGVTKGGFYGQFSDRPEFLAEMLDTWAEAVADAVIEEVEAGGGDARERLERLFNIAKARVNELFAVELAIREWARRSPVAEERLLRVDERRMEYMRSLFGEICADPLEVEARCLLAFSLFIGTNFVVAGHGKRTREQVLDATFLVLIR